MVYSKYVYKTYTHILHTHIVHKQYEYKHERMIIEMAKVISVAIQKGGCAKTTTTVNLASCLSLKGKKVLVVDCDPQANLSFACDHEQEEVTLYDALKNPGIVNKAIASTEEFDIIPSNILLAGGEREFTQTGREYLLRKVLRPIMDDYDYIILDCPPSLGVLTTNAFTISDYVVIPVEPSYFALQGLDQLKDTIDTVKEYFNEKLQILGILLIKYNSRSNINKFALEELEKKAEEYGVKLFKTTIRESVAVKESQSLQTPLSQHAPDSNPFLDYTAFAEEVMKGVEG